jgi:hypothetical protein
LLGACAVTTTTSEQSADVREPDDAVVVALNQQAIAAIAGATPASNPFTATRFMAIIHVAVFEAANAISHKYTPYFGVTAPKGADEQAAVITAAHNVMVALFPTEQATLDANQAAALAAIPDGKAKNDGIAVGQAAAQATLAARTNDGSVPAQFFVPPNTDPGMWQKTPSCPPAGGVFKHWSGVKPFGVDSNSQFRAGPPPTLDSAEYATSFNETQAVGGQGSTQRPQDRSDVARIYAGQFAHIGWNSMARQLMAQTNAYDKLTQSARIFALLNIALADGMFAVFDTKYTYNLWRPETAIPRADEDNNPLTVAGPFVPWVVTPCFPAYPSAHGIDAGAGAQVLAHFFGHSGYTLTNSDPSVPGVTLHYTDVDQMVHDISDARVFGGIHWRFDQDIAEGMGRQVADFVLANNLQGEDE